MVPLMDQKNESETTFQAPDQTNDNTSSTMTTQLDTNDNTNMFPVYFGNICIKLSMTDLCNKFPALDGFYTVLQPNTGYTFIEFSNFMDAQIVIAKLNGSYITTDSGRRTITVEESSYENVHNSKPKVPLLRHQEAFSDAEDMQSYIFRV
jgi:hypothetical protein